MFPCVFSFLLPVRTGGFAFCLSRSNGGDLLFSTKGASPFSLEMNVK